MANEDLEVVDNTDASRFEVHVGDDVAYSEYRRHDHVIVFTHTFVPPELEGHGIGGRLAKVALDRARADGVTVVARCPFIATYIRRHPEYQGLLQHTT
ncbi:MAG TPA: GNAT family N-acetyltransferase [Gemmatimonadaceae bacterium]